MRVLNQKETSQKGILRIKPIQRIPFQSFLAQNHPNTEGVLFINTNIKNKKSDANKTKIRRVFDAVHCVLGM